MVQKKKSPAKAQKKEKEAPKKQATPAKSKKKEPAQSPDSQNSLGKKFTCHSCGTKFYDLNRPTKICPKCGADQSLKPTTKQRGKASKVSEYDIAEDEITDVAEELIEEGEELELEEEPVIDEEEV